VGRGWGVGCRAGDEWVEHAHEFVVAPQIEVLIQRKTERVA
jgi:hypothetical protein